MIQGCRIKKVNNGYAVKETVFQNKEDAEIFAFYLKIVLNNKKKLVYVGSEEEAITKHLEIHPEKNNDNCIDWYHLCWQRNAERYFHFEEGIYALNNRKSYERI